MITTLLIMTALVAEPVEGDGSVALHPALKVSLGYGQSTGGGNGIEGEGEGGSLAAEYIWRLSTWFSPRVYAGMLYTSPRPTSCTIAVSPCDVTARIGFVGAKARFLAPLGSWIGPFVELGGGGSVGEMRTLVGTATTIDCTGVFYHLAWGAGVALGERYQYELLVSYLEHPAEKQRDGGVAVSFQFEL